MNNLKQKIGGALLTLSIMTGVAIATSATTHAQWNRNDGWQRQRDYEREQRRRQREWEREQRRAQRQAQREARRTYGYNDPYYRNNDPYNRDNGGYYGNSGHFDNARQTALNAGYNNGIEEGRKDRQRGERFEYRDEGDYRSATEDYSSRLGIDREQYRAYFRQGFANGYRAGYNGY